MKNIIAIGLLAISFTALSQDAFFKDADSFFKKYVDENGLVDYKAIGTNSTMLEGLVGYIAAAPYDEFDDETKRAFLINTYNILVIRQVVDLLPLKSPLDNGKFFNGIKHEVAGKQMTLDEVEKGKLMVEFPDSRAHFVLVCAAKSCPPLANFGYFPKGIDNQLDERTKTVLNLDWFIRVNKKTELSQIFNWYRGDFEVGGKSLVDYINEYRNEKIEVKKTSFYEYDWTLNIK